MLVRQHQTDAQPPGLHQCFTQRQGQSQHVLALIQVDEDRRALGAADCRPSLTGLPDLMHHQAAQQRGSLSPQFTPRQPHEQCATRCRCCPEDLAEGEAWLLLSQYGSEVRSKHEAAQLVHDWCQYLGRLLG